MTAIVCTLADHSWRQHPARNGKFHDTTVSPRRTWLSRAYQSGYRFNPRRSTGCRPSHTLSWPKSFRASASRDIAQSWQGAGFQLTLPECFEQATVTRTELGSRVKRGCCSDVRVLDRNSIEVTVQIANTGVQQQLMPGRRSTSPPFKSANQGAGLVIVFWPCKMHASCSD